MAALSPSVPGPALVELNDPALNGGLDNSNYDLIVYEGSVIEANNGRFVIEKFLGSGTFSRVYQVSEISSNAKYALKIGKSDDNSREQLAYECRVLQYLKDQMQLCIDHSWFFRYDLCFDYATHTCILMELFGKSVYDTLCENSFIGMDLRWIQAVLTGVLKCLAALQEREIIHGDVKPENIVQDLDGSLNFTLIDYGIATKVKPHVQIVQSVYYRAPEVIMYAGLDCKADVWSLGCVAAELFLGVPLFLGKTPAQLLYLMNKSIGPFPKDMVSRLEKSVKNAYFDFEGVMKKRYILCSELGEDVMAEDRFKYQRLVDNIMNYRRKKDDVAPISEEEAHHRKAFADLLQLMLKLDSNERCSAKEALQHEFMRIVF